MDTVTAEKRTAMFRYRLLQRTTTLLRFLEALILTLLAVWCSARIPSAAKASGELLRRIIPVLLGPRFLFLLANAIVLSLIFFFNSRHVTTTTTSIDDQISSAFPPPPPPPPPAVTDVVVFEDKNVCSMETRTPPPPHVQRTCRRSRSEKMMGRRRSPDLRRSETDVGKGKVKGEEEEEDAEEFRRTIEAFIEKQLRFQREEESMAIVFTDGGDSGLLTCSAGTVEAKGK